MTPNSNPSRQRVGSNFFRARQQYRDRVGVLRGHDHLLIGLDDARLLGCDRVDRVAEVGHVIEIDGGDHRDRSVHDIRRVEPTAHTDLDNCDVDGSVGEGRERHAGHGFEERQPRLVGRVDEIEERRDLVVGLHESCWRQWLAVDADAFEYRFEVRTRVPAGAQIEAAQQGIDHPRRRRLAVGARDVHDGIREMRVAQKVHQRAHALELPFDARLGPAAEQLLLDPFEFERLLTHRIWRVTGPAVHRVAPAAAQPRLGRRADGRASSR